jgi:5-methylcytosine-specific restriction endonuclease McrA
MAGRKALRERLRERQAGRCCYCLNVMTAKPVPKKGVVPKPSAETLEHLHRVMDGGSSRADNMALACFRCNSERGGIDWLTYTSYRRGELA